MRTNTLSVVFTIDTEPDNVWADHRSSTLRNIPELLRLQDLFDRFEARATLLVSYNVLLDDAAVKILQRLAEHHGAEVGAHLHPWETPPFLENDIDRTHPIYPHELPIENFEAKIEELTRAIRERFGQPTSYRGGRWGIAAEHLPILERHGYTVDTTVTPGIDWRGTHGLPRNEKGLGGIDFRSYPTFPYVPSHRDMERPGEDGISEIPVTMGFSRAVPGFLGRLVSLWPNTIGRLLRRTDLVRPVWAFPAEETRHNLDRMLQQKMDDNSPVTNVALHSSELLAGGAPKSQTTCEVAALFGKLKSILECHSTSDRCEFSTLTRAAARWHGAQACHATNTLQNA